MCPTILLTTTSGLTTTLPSPPPYKRMTPVLPPAPDMGLLHAPQVLMVRTPRSRPKRRESLPAHVPAPPSSPNGRTASEAQRGRTPRTPRVARSPRSLNLASTSAEPSGSTESSGSSGSSTLTPPPLSPRPAHMRTGSAGTGELPISVADLSITDEEPEKKETRERPRGRQRPSTVDAGAPSLPAIAERDAPSMPCAYQPVMTRGPRLNSGYSGTCSRSKL